MSYYLAPSLVTLRSLINSNWPNRDKSSDGWIGDPSHQARKSDHNPDYADGGVVRAIDVDEDGIDVQAVINAVIYDPAVSYVIYEGRIWGGSRWRAYTGANKHDKHMHISIKHTKTAERDKVWNLKGGGKVTPVGNTKPSGQPTDYKDLAVDGIKGKATVEAWQILMRAVGTYTRAVDGVWGEYTARAIQTWLRQVGFYKRGQYVIDGKWGAASVEELQKFLAKKKHLDTKKWRIDGKEGAETVKAEQRYLNTQNGGK